MDTLEQLRKKINTIDDHIIGLLAQRFSIVVDIWAYKKEHLIPALDERRWAVLFHENIAKGKKKWLSEIFIIDLRESIHKEALKLQQ